MALTQCTICREHFATVQYHHTTPRCYGGEDSLQIPLCATCHNLLHIEAESALAGRKPREWKTAEAQSNAVPYIRLIVEAARTFKGVKSYSMHLKIPQALYKALKDSQQGMSLEKTILTLLAESLRTKGMLHEHQNGKRDPQSTKPDLW